MMFVGRPVPNIQAPDLNQKVLLSLFQDAFCEGSGAEFRKERQDVKTDHTGSHYTQLSLSHLFRALEKPAPSIASLNPDRGRRCRGVLL